MLEKYEVPNDPSLLKRIELAETANIVEGYTLFKNDDTSEFPYKFYSEININNSKLWDLMLALSNELPAEVSLIFNFADENPNFGRYTSKIDTLNFLNNYKVEIVQDTFIEIGMIFQTENELIEVFISDSKYIKFWGTNLSSFLKTMKEYNLKAVQEIKFIDEFPKVRVSLGLLDKTVKTPQELKHILDEKFQFV